MKRFGLAALLAFVLPFVSVAARADEASQPVTVTQLQQMDQEHLNRIYLDAAPGAIPDGDSEGTAVFFPGTLINTPTQLLAAMVWQGKVFDTEDGILVNKVFGFHAIKAKVYLGDSLFDGKQSIIIDYSKTSILAHAVRDEIREVAPQLYLGRAYLRTLLGDFMVVNFILDFHH